MTAAAAAAARARSSSSLALVAALLAGAAAAAAASQLPSRVLLHDGSNSVRCRGSPFDGNRFSAPAGTDSPAGRVTAYIQRNQLYIEGSSPMVVFEFNGNGTLLQKSMGAWYTSEAKGFLPTFRPGSGDPACSLATPLASWAAAHPAGPAMQLDTGLLADLAAYPGAWVPQGFHLLVSSRARGELYRASRGFDGGARAVPTRSTAKAFTAALALALVDRSLLALDDPASKYLPEYASGQLGAITLRMLLGHTSGLPALRDGPPLRNATTLLQSAALIAAIPLEGAPGTVFIYSELGYQVAGAIIEVASGLTFASALRRYITEPLGMDSTIILNQWQGAASRNPNPAHGGISSPNDQARFLEMLVNKGAVQRPARGSGAKTVRVLSEASAVEMVTPQFAVSREIENIFFKKWLSTVIEPPVTNGLGFDQAAAAAIARLWQNGSYALGLTVSGVQPGPRFGRGFGVGRHIWLLGQTGQLGAALNVFGPDPTSITSSTLTIGDGLQLGSLGAYFL